MVRRIVLYRGVSRKLLINLFSSPEKGNIINDKNRIYHLNLKKDEIADNIILVGDPSRVSQISKKFEKIEYKIEHREFITHTGFFKNKRK